MSSTEAPSGESVTRAEPHDAHPSPRQYVNVAVVLALLTALEVSTYYFDFGILAIPLLVVLMIVKFIYVASYFMHLKFDTKVFSQLMYAGLSLAVVLYAAAILILVFGSATRI